jgi:hypothetical protein
MLPGARETAADRNSRLFHELSKLNPEVVTIQECDAKILHWLQSRGYQIALGLMSSNRSLISSCNESAINLTRTHLAVAIASKIGLSNARCHAYHPDGFWPKESEKSFAQTWQDSGGVLAESNLQPVLLVAEVDNISIGVTHGPWDISTKPISRDDCSGAISKHQKKGILDLCRVIREKEANIDIVAGDSNTHSTFKESMFAVLSDEFKMQMAISPAVIGTLDRDYFKLRNTDWAKILCPDNVLFRAAKFKLSSVEQVTGISDHHGQVVGLERVRH